MLNFEALTGRRMAVDRQFYMWDDPIFPTADDLWDAQGGRTPYLSWDAATRTGHCVLWTDIASGIDDAAIDAEAAAIAAFPYPIIFSFGHEPMTAVPSHETCGQPSDYIAAYRHVHDRMEADGVTNVTWAWTVTAQSFQKHNAINYYPGDDVVDLIAADGYNWYGCTFHPGPWRSFQEVFQPFYDFGVEHDRYLFVAEYGTGEDAEMDGRKGQWFTDAAATLRGWPLLKGVSYFNVGGGDCARYVDTSASSLAAFRAVGADPYANPPMPETTIDVSDAGFSPGLATAAQGTVVTWSFEGPGSHTATDATGMGLFDSGLSAAGVTYSTSLIGAGTYRYRSVVDVGMTGKIAVPMTVQPRSGTVGTTFTVTWAADLAPTGFSFDTQIRRPGSAWTDWLTAQTMSAGSFVPDAGVGTYLFRARYHKSDGTLSAYSPAIRISVTP
jgi:plastocyanin